MATIVQLCNIFFFLSSLLGDVAICAETS